MAPKYGTESNDVIKPKYNVKVTYQPDDDEQYIGSAEDIDDETPGIYFRPTRPGFDHTRFNYPNIISPTRKTIQYPSVHGVESDASLGSSSRRLFNLDLSKLISCLSVSSLILAQSFLNPLNANFFLL